MATTPPSPPAPSVASITPPPPLTAAVAVTSLPPLAIQITHAGDGNGGKKDLKEFLLLVLSSLLSPALILLFGYLLTGKLDQLFKQREQDLKEREFHSQNIHQMQELLTDLEDPAVKQEKAHASAVAMSAYGQDSVPLLLHVLTENTQYGGEAAQDALLALEKDDAAAACTRLADILGLRIQRYAFPAHRRVLRALRDLDCRDQLPALRAYQTRLQAGPPYPFHGIAEGQPPLQENVDSVADQLNKTLHDLTQ